MALQGNEWSDDREIVKVTAEAEAWDAVYDVNGDEVKLPVLAWANVKDHPDRVGLLFVTVKEDGCVHTHPGLVLADGWYGGLVRYERRQS